MDQYFNTRKENIFNEYESLISRPNQRIVPGNGIYERYKFPALTRDHIPPHWMYDFNPETNIIILIFMI